jgi:SAM-dependent methyltransferase
MRRRLVPAFDAFYGNAVAALEFLASGPVERVLDLGAGTALMSTAVAQAYPAARFELLDESKEMLEVAQERLPGRDRRGPRPGHGGGSAGGSVRRRRLGPGDPSPQ